MRNEAHSKNELNDETWGFNFAEDGDFSVLKLNLDRPTFFIPFVDQEMSSMIHWEY